jgi:outer membrane autotransporter protein
VFSEIFGGSAVSNDGPANATGNTVNFTGGTAGSIYGGSTWITTFATTYSAAATGNRVFINGGTISNTVYGGYAMVGISGSGNGSSINNTVTITGAPDLTGTTLYGGYIYDGISSTGNGDAFSGNTLNLHSSGLTMAGMANFEKLNFYLPVTMTSDQTMLTVTGTADLTDGASRSSTVNVGIEGSSSPLQTGDQVILIDAGTLTTNSALNTTANGSGMQGVTLKYEFDIMASGNQLLATVNSSGPKVNEQAKALPEGFLSGLALTNLGADLIAGPGLSNAVNAAGNAARASVSTNSGLATFGALSGGWSRYQTGSHVDMSSISLMAGLAFGTDLAPGHLTLAGFFEYGNGSYDTYNSFSNAASVHGDGDIYHIGGGVLGRMDFLDTGPGHFYVEASGRAGGVHNEYTNGDLRDSQNRRAEYDTSSTYYGLHLGVGYLWNINEKASLDLYGKYFWTRQEGDSVTLSTGDPVKFDDVDSHRLRGGARFAYAVNEHVSPYVGAAWEHEFDGRARATTNGFDIDAPSLRGDTGMGELGLTLKPSQTLPLSFDLGVQGYTGKREGVTGSLQLRYNF